MFLGVLPCLVGVLIFGGPRPQEHDYRVVQVTQGCGQLSMFIQRGIFVMENQFERVEIPLPDDAGWHRLEYLWDSNTAMIERWAQVPVRRGPKSPT